jgi:tRNA pseudouridine38-40 synthase
MSPGHWQRYLLTVAYHGKYFVGFAKQPRSYGASIERILHQAYFDFIGAGNFRDPQGSSRTDSGVHAFGNTAHVDLIRKHKKTGNTLEPHSPATVQKALNFYIKTPHLSVSNCVAVPSDFHARYSCTGRTYLYRILVPLSEMGRNVFDQDYAWICENKKMPLNVNAMKIAANSLEGKHDFSTFRSSGCQASSPVKSLHSLTVSERIFQLPESNLRSSSEDVFGQYEHFRLAGNGHVMQEVLVKAHAPSFLYHQVRNLVGFLVSVGRHDGRALDVESALAAKSRDACPLTAPPEGLALARVHYDGEDLDL